MVDHGGVLIAHGHKPVWVNGALTEECREQLRALDLHFHDLRHEAGCRWLEAGWPIHHVQEMLGHANLSQTSTYLHANELGLQESMSKFDTGKHGNDMATEAPIEQPPHGHASTGKDDNKLLH